MSSPAARRTARRVASIADAFVDQNLFGRWFAGASWANWRVVLRAAQGLRLTKAEQAFFAEVAGGRAPPTAPVKELWICVGRRGGKDSVASGIAAYTAAMFKNDGQLRPGEHATIACLAVNRDQAGILHGYVSAYFRELPALRAMVKRETASTIELKNAVDIVVTTSNYRALRGKSYLLVVADEIAVWRDEDTSLNPDKEIFRSLRPGMATLPKSMFIGISSPFKRSGLLYERWSKYFGKDDPRILVIHAPSTALNPTLDEAEIAAAMQDDPLAARSDFLAEWRDDLASYIPRDLIEAAVDRDITVRPYERGHRYFAFLDAAEGLSASGDSFAAAIAHNQRDGDRDISVLDWMQEWRPPFNPAQIVRAIAGVLDEYRLGAITGDHHAAGFVINELLKCGKRLTDCELTKSDVYMELLPRFSASCVRLLDSDHLANQFCALERKTISGGTSKVDHPRGSHDDLCNAVAGALWCAGRKRGLTHISESVKAWAAIPQRVNRLDGGPGWMSLYNTRLKERREPKTIATISTIDRPAGAVFRVGLGGSVTRVADADVTTEDE